MIKINEVAKGGASPLPAASEKLSDLMRAQECPGSQNYPVMLAASLGGEDDEDGNESEDERGCGVEVVAAGEVAVESAVTGERSGHVSEKNAKQEVEQG